MLELLSEREWLRKDLRDTLVSEGHTMGCIRGNIRKFEAEGKIVCEGSNNSPRQVIRLEKEEEKS